MLVNFEVLKEAGLTTTDIATVFKVSRTTVHNWKLGNGVHPLIKDRVADTTAKIEKLVEERKLPIISKGKERAAELTKLILQ